MPDLFLSKSATFNASKGPLLLVIMDGIGLAPASDANAVTLAKTPSLDGLMSSPLYTTLKAHGTAVGMPSDADMGNSEVGHNALGAGRVFQQGASLVKTAIESGRLFEGETWTSLASHCVNGRHTFHFLGLLSDGNVHAHIDHLLAMLDALDAIGQQHVRLHILLDGRDVGSRTALLYISRLEARLSQINRQVDRDYRIASGGGRMVSTMDRYNADWPMVELGWNTVVHGQGPQVTSATEAIQSAYDDDPELTDQYLPSFVVAESGKAIGPVKDNDVMVFFNFRGDRAIEMSMAFEQDDFNRFDRGRRPHVRFAGMMEYDGDLHIPQSYLVSPPEISGSIAAYMAANGLRSFALSETQKFGHVTYFWNGNRTGYIDETLERYVEIPSHNVPFDQAPEMRAAEITDTCIELLKSGQYDFGRINYPNGDMVGHTGNVAATIASVEAMDNGLGRLMTCVKALHGRAIFLADHGNADEMFVEKDGMREMKTSHTLNPVPFSIYDPNYDGHYKMAPLKTRGLSNVAATILNLMGYEAPAIYDPSLIAPA